MLQTQEQFYLKQIAAQRDNLQFMLKRRHTSGNKVDVRSSIYSIIEHLRYLQTQV